MQLIQIKMNGNSKLLKEKKKKVLESNINS